MRPPQGIIRDTRQRRRFYAGGVVMPDTPQRYVREQEDRVGRHSVVHGKASGSPGKAEIGFQVKSIQGLCALRRSTTTPTAILEGGKVLMRPPRDA